MIKVRKVGRFLEVNIPKEGIFNIPLDNISFIASLEEGSSEVVIGLKHSKTKFISLTFQFDIAEIMNIVNS